MLLLSLELLIIKQIIEDMVRLTYSKYSLDLLQPHLINIKNAKNVKNIEIIWGIKIVDKIYIDKVFWFLEML